MTGESAPLDPPLNMMSFMISVKFLLIGDAQILCFSGKFNLKSSVDRVLSTSSFLHGVIFLALEEEISNREFAKSYLQKIIKTSLLLILVERHQNYH